MSALTLTPTRFCQGVWHGILEHAGTEEPQVAVTHLSSKIPDVQVTKVDNQWSNKVPIPIETIGDGVQVFIITDEKNDKKIGDFTIIAGDAPGSDIRTEVELLRAELDVLKRAFRRHCVETM